VFTTTVTNTAATATDRVSGIDLHAFRFGLTHYFDAPAAGAYALVTKAPPPAAPPWTGLYGGVSAGLTSMHTRTASTAPSFSPRRSRLPALVRPSSNP